MSGQHKMRLAQVDRSEFVSNMEGKLSPEEINLYFETPLFLVRMCNQINCAKKKKHRSNKWVLQRVWWNSEEKFVYNVQESSGWLAQWKTVYSHLWNEMPWFYTLLKNTTEMCRTIEEGGNNQGSLESTLLQEERGGKRGFESRAEIYNSGTFCWRWTKCCYVNTVLKKKMCKERNQEHHVLLYCSGDNSSPGQEETDCAVMYDIYTWPVWPYEAPFSLLPLKALLKEAARCVLAFDLSRATWESPVWPVNRFSLQPAVSPVCDGARSERRPCHAPIAQFKWKLDELLGSDPAIQNN